MSVKFIIILVMFLNSFKSVWFLLAITTLVLFFLVTLAYNQSWRYHLDVDVWGFYYPRLVHFLDNLSFAGIGENEYFPGAMFFFLIPGLALLFGPNNAQTYLAGLITVNILTIIILLYLYRRHNHFSPLIFLAILLFSGPIFFFRHDLFVSLVVILSLLLWKLHKRNFAALILGISVSIKIYPLLILPYFLILSLKNYNLRKSVEIFVIFISGAFLVFGLYSLLGSSPNEILDTIHLNSLKPVHIESLWGSFLTIFSKMINGQWALGKGEHGIFGIDSRYIFLPLTFYNYFWIIPLGIFYLSLYKKVSKNGELMIEAVFLILLLFIIFSKILTGQYIFWILALFPLFKYHQKLETLYVISFLIILFIVFLTQYIYPLHYNELLGIFYTSGSQVKYFYILLLRNLLLLVLFVLVAKYAFEDKISGNT